MSITLETIEYDFALLADPGESDAARAVLEALCAAANSAGVRAPVVLEDISGAPMNKEHLSKLVRCRALLLLCSPRSMQSAKIAQRLTCFDKLGRNERIVPLLIEGDTHASICGAQNGGGMAVDLRADSAGGFYARLEGALADIQARLNIPVGGGHTVQAGPVAHIEREAGPVAHTEQEPGPVAHTEQEPGPVAHTEQEQGPVAHTEQEPTRLPAPIAKKRKKRKSMIALAGLCLILICLLIALVNHRNELRAKSAADAQERIALSQEYRSRAASMDGQAALALYKQSVECLLPAQSDQGVSAELPAALCALGDSHFALGEYEAADLAYSDMCARALKHYESAGGANALEALTAAEFHYARALMESERYDTAAEYCRLALSRTQALAGGVEDAAARLSGAYAALGEILKRAGDYSAAREALTQVLVYRTQLSADGENASLCALANAYYELAQNELSAGDYEAARRHFDQCLIHYAPAASALGGQILGHYLTLSVLHALLFEGDAAQAVRDAEEAKTLIEGDAFVDCVFACAAMIGDRYQQSISAFEALIEGGEQARIQNVFALLRAMGRSHPLMEEVEARFVQVDLSER